MAEPRLEPDLTDSNTVFLNSCFIRLLWLIDWLLGATWKAIFWCENVFFFLHALACVWSLGPCVTAGIASVSVVSPVWPELRGASSRRCSVPCVTMPEPSRPLGTGLMRSYQNSHFFFPAWGTSVLFFLMVSWCLNGLCILENLVFLSVFLYVLRVKKIINEQLLIWCGTKTWFSVLSWGSVEQSLCGISWFKQQLLLTVNDLD